MLAAAVFIAGAGLRAAQVAASFGDVFFSPDGKTIAATELTSHHLALWDVATGRKLGGYDNTFSPPVVFSADGKTLVIGRAVMKFMDVASGAVTVLENDRGFEQWAFSQDGRTELVKSSGGFTVKTLARPFDHRSGQDSFPLAGAVSSPKGRFSAHTPSGRFLDDPFSPDGRTVVVFAPRQGKGTPVMLWDVAAKKLTATLPVQSYEPETLFSPDGRILAVNERPAITLYDTAAGRPLGALERVEGKPFDSLLFSPDSRTLIGRIVVQKGGAHLVRVWNAATGKWRADLPMPNSLYAFSADSRTLTTVSTAENVIRRWDMATGRVLATFPLPQNAMLASGQPAAVPGPLTGGRRAVLGSLPVLSADGTLLARGVSDGTIRVWTIGPAMDPQGKVLGPLTQPAPKQETISDIPPGTKIVSVGTKIFFQDAAGRRTPAPDGNYRMPNVPNYILRVRHGEKVKF